MAPNRATRSRSQGNQTTGRRRQNRLNLYRYFESYLVEIFMNSLRLFRSLMTGVALFSLGIATTLVAQTLTDSPQRVEQKRADLSGASGMEVIASTGEYKPGESIELHVHHGIEAAFVVQGAMVQMPGREPTGLQTGATLLNLREIKHGGFKVVGDTPLKLFTVHIVDKGKPLYDYVK
jgi:quercetin dioxygenase-like cupin family protein